MGLEKLRKSRMFQNVISKASIALDVSKKVRGVNFLKNQEVGLSLSYCQGLEHYH